MDRSWTTVFDFLSKTLSAFGFTSGIPEFVMDVGSGPGYMSRNHILPCFPNLKKMIAIDIASDMVEEAKLRHPHPKIEYVIANIEDRSTVQQWIGKITKLTAIHSFNWLKNPRKGFETVYDLLKPGGEAAFLFGLSIPYHQAMIKTGMDRKYISYFEKVDYFNPLPEHYFYSITHYQNMLEEMGLEVIYCEDRIKQDYLHFEGEFGDLFYTVCPLIKYLPVSLRDKFKEDVAKNIFKQGCHKTSEDGRTIFFCKTIEIIVRKEE